jgi:hypothetical protein
MFSLNSSRSCPVLRTYISLNVSAGFTAIKHPTDEVWGEMYSSTYLNFVTRWRWVVSFTPWSLYSWRQRPESKAETNKRNKLRGFRPQSELYRPSDRGLSAKLMPTLADRWLDGVAWSAQRNPTAVNFGFLDRSHYFSIQGATQLSSRG